MSDPVVSPVQGEAAPLLDEIAWECPHGYDYASGCPNDCEPPSGVQGEAVETDENACQQCGRDNPVWFAPNEVWNAVMGNHTGFLCPACFIARAEQAGIVPTAWELRPEVLAPVAGSPSPERDGLADRAREIAELYLYSGHRDQPLNDGYDQLHSLAVSIEAVVAGSPEHPDKREAIAREAAVDHDFLPVNGHPDDDECTHRADGTDVTYCGLPREAHEHLPGGSPVHEDEDEQRQLEVASQAVLDAMPLSWAEQDPGFAGTAARNIARAVMTALSETVRDA